MSPDGVGRAADVEKTPQRAVFYSRNGQAQAYLYAFSDEDRKLDL